MEVALSTSKSRPLWSELSAPVRASIERLLGAPVSTARNCPGGFSPGFASRLTLADGRRAFVKAMDAGTWPLEAVPHRTEALTTAALPAIVPAPRLLGTFDDGRWTVLAFEDIDGTEPCHPWDPADLTRVVTALGHLARAATPSPVPLPVDHPRLGGWAALARDRPGLPAHSTWAAANLDALIGLEAQGMAAAQGPSLVHGDLYPHNILLTPSRVVFVDWPHARLGAPAIDLVTVLSSAAADGLDPEPFLPGTAEPATIDAILAAHTGFLLAGGLSPPTPGLEAITAAKLHLAQGALTWLHHRLTRREVTTPG
jgi:Ser/Thr protein kinase RdoA (MazF antagonist)